MSPQQKKVIHHQTTTGMKQTIITILIILVYHAMPAQPLTLDSIISKIKQRNPALKQFEQREAAAHAYASGASAWDAPQIGAGLYMIPYKYDPNMGSVMFTFTQMFPNRAKQRANENYMKGMASIESENRNVKFNLLSYQAKIHFYNWLILKKKQSVFNESENLMNYIIKTSEIRYTLEKEKLNNIYKAKSELSQLKSMQVMNESEIEERRIALNGLLKQSASEVFDIDTAYALKDYDTEAQDTASLTKQRSDLRAMQRNIELMKMRLALENTKLKPEFGIRLDHANGFGMQPNQYSIMAMMNLPIAPWASGMYKANAKGISYEIESMQSEKENMQIEASSMVSSIQNELKYKKKILGLYHDQILPSLSKNYRIALLAYEQNTEELFMVLDAWQNLKMAQLENLSILKELLIKQIEYEKETEKQ